MTNQISERVAFESSAMNVLGVHWAVKEPRRFRNAPRGALQSIVTIVAVEKTSVVAPEQIRDVLSKNRCFFRYYASPPHHPLHLTANDFDTLIWPHSIL